MWLFQAGVSGCGWACGAPLSSGSDAVAGVRLTRGDRELFAAGAGVFVVMLAWAVKDGLRLWRHAAGPDTVLSVWMELAFGLAGLGLAALGAVLDSRSSGEGVEDIQ